MGCIEGCGESPRGAGFRRYLDLLEQQQRLLNIPKELIAAVCLRESEGYRWFNLTDRQYKQNMREWIKGDGRSESLLQPFVKIPTGVNAGFIAKFRYEPSWENDANRWAAKSDDVEFFETVMPLSFGFGQKAMWIYLAGYTPMQWRRLFHAFLNDPYVQLIQVAKDLNELISETKGNVPLALTRYNGPRKAHNVSEYGKAVFANYRVLATHNNKETT